MANFYALTIVLCVLLCAIHQSQAQTCKSDELAKLIAKDKNCAEKFNNDIAPCNYRTSRDMFQVMLDNVKDLSKATAKICCLGQAAIECLKPVLSFDVCKVIKDDLAKWLAPEEKKLLDGGCTQGKYNCTKELADLERNGTVVIHDTVPCKNGFTDERMANLGLMGAILVSVILFKNLF